MLLYTKQLTLGQALWVMEVAAYLRVKENQ